jgi:predicted amidohydrolase
MQTAYVQFMPVLGDIAQNLRKIERLVDGADAELIVLPELCNTGYFFTSRKEAEGLGEEVPAGRTTELLCRLAKAKNAHLVAGMIEKCGDKLFNAALLVGPAGPIATYRKIHLFHEETLWFDPGDRDLAVYDIGPCRVGLMICFDWLFPETARTLALRGADLICHPANLVLPYCQEAMVTRCLENRVFAVTANRTGAETRGGKELRFTGKSQITAPDGSILKRATETAEEIGVVDIDAKIARNKTINPFNDAFGSRRPEYYGELVQTKRP